jgi:hypothetical protein
MPPYAHKQSKELVEGFLRKYDALPNKSEALARAGIAHSMIYELRSGKYKNGPGLATMVTLLGIVGENLFTGPSDTLPLSLNQIRSLRS